MAAYTKLGMTLLSGTTMTTVFMAAAPLSLSADGVEGHPAPETKPKKLLRPSELSIYDVHSPCHCGHKKKTDGQQSGGMTSALELEIGRTRRSILNSLDALTDTKDRAVVFYQTGKAHTLDTVAYLREESNTFARVGAISGGGLIGLLLAARRGFFKKLFYGGGGMAAVATLCYPNEASQISNGAFTIGKYYAYVAYHKLEDEVRARSSSFSSSSSSANVETSKPVDKPAANQKDVMVHSAGKEKKEKIVGDFGQSNPEDADLYTTRSS